MPPNSFHMRVRLSCNPADKIVVYTAIYGPLDYGPGFAGCVPTCDCVVFTDDTKLIAYLERRKSPFMPIYRAAPHPDPRRACRYFKTMPDTELSKYDISLWVDGNTCFRQDPAGIIRSEMISSAYMAYPHWNGVRDVYVEGHRCVVMRKALAAEIEPQLQEYRKTKYDSTIIAACTYIMRRHNIPGVIEFGRAWWNEILQFSARDQISWDFLRWKMDLQFEWIKTNRTSWVTIGPHARRRLV